MSVETVVEMKPQNVEHVRCNRCGAKTQFQTRDNALEGWVCCHLLLPSPGAQFAELIALLGPKKGGFSDDQHLCGECWKLFETFIREHPAQVAH